ncbi:hypothetical protein BKM31_39490 [[Actinomadura] parvosata subsp. kistnae]|uniref:Uncharacterized protein n=1 Tax=[Actinomadura] parvosata subsp. kistnae TaxID=1909395 RepID=A0A1V0A969_9ACTN|nr:hypothetical protein BKM31_39490 [Nonomuraea sp. ATCC 55076]
MAYGHVEVGPHRRLRRQRVQDRPGGIVVVDGGEQRGGEVVERTPPAAPDGLHDEAADHVRKARVRTARIRTARLRTDLVRTARVRTARVRTTRIRMARGGSPGVRHADIVPAAASDDRLVIRRRRCPWGSQPGQRLPEPYTGVQVRVAGGVLVPV